MSQTNDADRAGTSREQARHAHWYTQIRLRRAERYVKSNLLWHRLYRATSYLKSALWIIPFIAILIVLAIAPALRVLDARLDWRFTGLDIDGARALYGTVITLTLSFIVFTFGSLLVAIQVAGGQLTPRIIATTLLRDNVVRYTVGLFVFTLVLAVMALNRLGSHVLQLVALLTAVLGISSMAAFLFLIDYAARLLRPVTMLTRIGGLGLNVIESVYPQATTDSPEAHSEAIATARTARRIVRHPGDSEIVLAVDLETLVVEAARAGGVIEFIPQVGDFVAHEEPLFALYDGAAAVDDRKLLAAVAFGPERTLEQDPIFAFRIIADIGLKALSPAINDPTTGVLAIDQLQRLLREVGKRQLHDEEITDDRDELRVIYRTPNWEDFVHVACNEIRNCGAGNVQIARRLRALLDNLLETLPAHRHRALIAESGRLNDLLDTLYAIPEDRALARIPDTQGLGGSSRARINSDR